MIIRVQTSSRRDFWILPVLVPIWRHFKAKISLKREFLWSTCASSSGFEKLFNGLYMHQIHFASLLRITAICESNQHVLARRQTDYMDGNVPNEWFLTWSIQLKLRSSPIFQEHLPFFRVFFELQPTIENFLCVRSSYNGYVKQSTCLEEYVEQKIMFVRHTEKILWAKQKIGEGKAIRGSTVVLWL